jgi:hypothetical protein
MPKTPSFDRDALEALLNKQHGVLSREQTAACGLPPHLVRHRVRADGPWQVLVPGVYLTHTGAATADQRDMAALLYAGPRSIITASAALRRFGLVASRSEVVEVLVPDAIRRRTAGFACLWRTTRLPEVFCVAGEIRYALPPRAVADAARHLGLIRDVRAVVAEAVQQGKCPLDRLAEEVRGGPMKGSGLLRQALAEVSEGIRSTAEGDLRDLIVRARLPRPMFNPRLFAGRTFLGVPDCWWPESGIAAEVDSRAWHLSPRDWEQTLARHARMSAHGIIVLHFTPGQIRSARHEVTTAIGKALAAGRTLPAIRALPAN